MNKEERFEIELNQEDVQNIINCYEKDIEYIKQLEQQNKELQKENQSLRTRIKTIKRRRKHQTQKLNKYKLVVTDLRNALEKKNNKIDKAIDYIKKYQQIYDIDGSIEKQIDEFNVLASPKKLLEILKGSDVDE